MVEEAEAAAVVVVVEEVEVQVQVALRKAQDTELAAGYTSVWVGRMERRKWCSR